AEWISAGSIPDRGESGRDFRTGWTRTSRDVRLSSAAPRSVVRNVSHAVQRLAHRWRLSHSQLDLPARTTNEESHHAHGPFDYLRARPRGADARRQCCPVESPL